MFKTNLSTFCPQCKKYGLKNKLFKFESFQYANKSLLFCVSSKVTMIKFIINLIYFFYFSAHTILLLNQKNQVIL